jgi:hypothetical protein
MCNITKHTFLRTGLLALDDISSSCPVCTTPLCDPFGSHPDALTSITIRACAHTYHPLCLMAWLEQNTSCPECREELFLEPKVKMMVKMPVMQVKEHGGEEEGDFEEEVLTWEEFCEVVGGMEEGVEKEKVREGMEWVEVEVDDEVEE